MSHNYAGLGYESIWKGAAASDTPALTIYRHFESASVHRGLLGNLPKTMWVIDYPLFERVYYALVAGFDVYGTVGHQLALRNYMDALRVEGESYFLDFMPPEQRREIMQSWYKGCRSREDATTTRAPCRRRYPSSPPTPSASSSRRWWAAHFAPAAKIGFDPVNYLRAGNPTRPAGEIRIPDDYLQAFRSLSSLACRSCP